MKFLLKNNYSTINKIKSEGKKIVFTNGCFDLLHVGHIKYLSQAKDLGDILIIGLNSDKSVKKLKGNNRPINSFEDRAKLLAALKSVDIVIMFKEQTPENVIENWEALTDPTNHKALEAGGKQTEKFIMKAMSALQN